MMASLSASGMGKMRESKSPTVKLKKRSPRAIFSLTWAATRRMGGVDVSPAIFEILMPWSGRFGDAHCSSPPVPATVARRLPLLCQFEIALAACSADRTATEPKYVTDGTGQLGAIQGVEMKVLDAVLDESGTLLGRDRGGDHVAHFRNVVEGTEQLVHPVGYHGAAGFGE